jgi:hypothetical protein
MTDYSIGTDGTLNKSDYTDFLKEWYQGTTVADLVYKNHPFLGIVPKNTNVRGNVYPKPIRYANITGQSATYLTAHEQQSPATRERWTCTHTDNYAKATVSNKVMELSMGDPAAFREALTDAVDSAYSAFANDLHFELLARIPKGGRATVTNVAGDPDFVLSAGEARFFEVGMRVQYSSAAQASLEDTGEIQIVEAVDRANDTITLDSDFTTPMVATDILYRAGDFDAKADSLGSWLPGSGVGATAFNGVDRTADPTRLAGVDGVKGATAPLLTDSLVQTGAELYNQGASPTHVLLSPADHGLLAFETEQRGRYAKVSSTEGSVSFSALEIMTGAGAVPCVAEPAVGSDSYYMIDTGSGMELYSAGGVPRMFNKDGNFYHREETADTLAFYLFGFYGLVVQNPGGNSFVTDAY